MRKESTLKIDLADVPSIERLLAFALDQQMEGWKYNRYNIVYSIEGNEVFDTGPIIKPRHLLQILQHLRRAISNPYDTHEQILLKQLKYERQLLFH